MAKKQIIDPGPKLLQKFSLPILPPTMNEMLALARSRSKNRKFCKYNLVKNEWHGIIAAIVASDDLLPYTVPVWIHLDFYCDKRKDYPNIEASHKFIFDGLVKCGVICSDSQKWLNPPTYSYYPPKEGVEVTVSICNYKMYQDIPLGNVKKIADKLVENLSVAEIRELHLLLAGV